MLLKLGGKLVEQEETGMLSLEDIQRLELDVLKRFHGWCVENNLRYSLAYGTLLGAIRHQGFIPWDNDMDIMMPRPDFERMLELSKRKPIDPLINVLHHSLDNKYHYQVARICNAKTKVVLPYLNEQPDKMGVWVDIFPLDGVSEDKIGENKVKQSYAEYFYKMLLKVDLYSAKESPIKGILASVLRRVFPNNNNLHMKKIDHFAKRTSFDKSVYVADMIEPNPIPLPREDFDNLQLAKYEDAKFFIPKHWDQYLTKAYGEYMVLPPMSQRMVHGIQAFWI